MGGAAVVHGFAFFLFFLVIITSGSSVDNKRQQKEEIKHGMKFDNLDHQMLFSSLYTTTTVRDVSAGNPSPITETPTINSQPPTATLATTPKLPAASAMTFSGKFDNLNHQMLFSSPYTTTTTKRDVSTVNPIPVTETPTVNYPPPTATTETTATTPVTTTTTPAAAATTSSGGAWCIASSTASQTALQVALDYACGYGGANCSAIQQGGSCYNPNTVRDHASYAFNDYYQNNPVSTSCVFGGTAELVYTDPSSGNCHYASPRTSTSMSSPPPPITQTPPSPLISANPTGGSTVYGEPTGSPSAAVVLTQNMLLLFCTTSIVIYSLAAAFQP
ncbi:hypothetical protein Nepgr_032077 [Nepenthes gracilis]|uniref:X8 domain-containing protein n=1 Tax=Nepenthes gracilis TaxID=150966 RepID=A0AAD3TJA3_NEPGR|nr:hypothetical protein Nepgr_032077 [Nepenthes gracilis]